MLVENRQFKLCRCLRDTPFSHFGTVPVCDRQTDRRTDTQR